MPQLSDPNFKRSVVLVVHHDAESTFGLVLNREVELTVEELCESLEFPWHGQRGAEVGWGGPVESHTGWLLFQDSLEMEVEEEHVSRLEGSLCFAGSMDVFRQLAEQPPADLRIFLGYAGWGSGQLESELAPGRLGRGAALVGGRVRRPGGGDVGTTCCARWTSIRRR